MPARPTSLSSTLGLTMRMPQDRSFWTASPAPSESISVDVLDDLFVGLERGRKLGAGISLGREQLRVGQPRGQVFRREAA